MVLIPNRCKMIFQEKDVDITQTSWSKTPDAYDLALYEAAMACTADGDSDPSAPPRAVLEVTIILVFEFRDGNTPALIWTDKEKKDFMATAEKEITDTWSEQHQ